MIKIEKKLNEMFNLITEDKYGAPVHSFEPEFDKLKNEILKEAKQMRIDLLIAYTMHKAYYNMLKESEDKHGFRYLDDILEELKELDK